MNNFRRRIFGYGFVPVPSCTFHTSARTTRGYTGEPESDIPGSLFPKHVQVSGHFGHLRDDAAILVTLLIFDGTYWCFHLIPHVTYGSSAENNQ